MKLSKILLATTLLSMALVGCGGSDVDTPTIATVAEETNKDKNTSSDKTVVYWSMWSEGEPQAAIITEAAKAYEADTGVKIDVQFKGRAANREALIPALDAGSTVDLFDESPDRIAGSMADYVYNLEEFVPEYEAEHANATLFKIVRKFHPTGELHAIPYQPSMTGYFYNKTLFDQAGIESVPTTWEEFSAVNQKLLDAGITPITMDDAYATLNLGIHLQRYIGQDDVISLVKGEPNADGNIISWNDERVVKALKDIEDFASKGYYSSMIATNAYPVGQNTEFAIGMAAMNYNGAWLPNEVKAVTGDEFEWGFFNYPTVTGGASDIGTNHLTSQSFGINKNSKVAKEAFGFIEYITTGAVDAQFVETALCIPTDKANTEWPSQLTEVKTAFEATTDDIIWAAGLESNTDLTPKLKEDTIKLMSGDMTAVEFIADVSK